MKDFSYCKKKDIKKWYKIRWKKYEFIFCFFPIVLMFHIADIIYNKIWLLRYHNAKWNDEKAHKILDYMLPNLLEYEEEVGYYLEPEWVNFGIRHNIPRRYRFWSKKFNGNLVVYLCESYEKDGYEKYIKKDNYDTWIIFKEKH